MDTEKLERLYGVACQNSQSGRCYTWQEISGQLISGRVCRKDGLVSVLSEAYLFFALKGGVVIDQRRAVYLTKDNKGLYFWGIRSSES